MPKSPETPSDPEASRDEQYIRQHSAELAREYMQHWIPILRNDAFEGQRAKQLKEDRDESRERTGRLRDNFDEIVDEFGKFDEEVGDESSELLTSYTAYLEELDRSGHLSDSNIELDLARRGFLMRKEEGREK